MGCDRLFFLFLDLLSTTKGAHNMKTAHSDTWFIWLIVGDYRLRPPKPNDFFFSAFPPESEYTNVRWDYRLSRSLLTLFSRLIDSNRISYYGYDIIKVSSAAQRFCTIIILLERYPILSGNYIYGNYIIYIFMPILHNHVLTFNPSLLDKIWNNEISQTLKFLHFYNYNN